MNKFSPEAGLGVMAILVPIFFGIFFVIFGIAFGVGAMKMGAPFIFGIGGAFFAIIGVCTVVTTILSALKMKNRIKSGGSFGDNNMDSPYNDEDDPFVASLGAKLRSGSEISLEDVDGSETGQGRRFEGEFCPFCGEEAGDGFNFCPKCGKDI